MQQPAHGGNVWRAARIYDLKPHEIIDFSANINPLGPSPRALEAIQAALEQIRHYPEPQADSLRAQIAQAHNLPEANLILGNGAAELIFALSRVLQPPRLLLPVPTFSEYAQAFAASRLVPIPLKAERSFALPMADLVEQLQPGDVAIVCNPNNPTGQLHARQELLLAAEQAQKRQAWLVVDEAFMDFVQPEQSLLPLTARNQHVVVLRSLTKFFAIPGLRLGYLAATPAVVQRLQQELPPWRVNTLAQVAGSASLADTAYQQTTLALLQEQKNYLYEGLAAIPGLQPYPPAANFILVASAASGYTARQLQEQLGPHGILIRQCHNFQGLSPYYFRVAVRTQRENRILLDHLTRIIVAQ